MLCCGFDSAVTDRANRLRWPRGRRRYDVAVLLELARLRPYEMTVRLDDGEPRMLPATMIAVGNTAWYGGGLRICPGADPADGLFDVTVVGSLTRGELVRARPRLAAGTHVDNPKVTVFRAARVELACPGVTTCADGEPVAAAARRRGVRARRAGRRRGAASRRRGTRLTWGHVQPR